MNEDIDPTVFDLGTITTVEPGAISVPATITSYTGLWLSVDVNSRDMPPFCRARLDLGRMTDVKNGPSLINDWAAARIECALPEGHGGPHGCNSEIFGEEEAKITSHRFRLTWERKALRDNVRGGG